MINQLLKPELTLCNVCGSSKKRILEKSAEFISQQIDGIDSESLFEHLTARERLGSTGIGKGIAIPHCRDKSIKRLTVSLVTLKDPIDFDSADDHPVDILFILAVPEETQDEHLKILAEIAQMVERADLRNQLRHCETAKELFSCIESYYAEK